MTLFCVNLGKFANLTILTKRLMALAEESIRWQIMYPAWKLLVSPAREARKKLWYDVLRFVLKTWAWVLILPQTLWWKEAPLLSSPLFYLTNNRILDDLMATGAICTEIYHHSFLFLPLLNWIMPFRHYRSVESHISLLPGLKWFGHVSIFRVGIKGKPCQYRLIKSWVFSPLIFSSVFNGEEDRGRAKAERWRSHGVTKV